MIYIIKIVTEYEENTKLPWKWNALLLIKFLTPFTNMD